MSEKAINSIMTTLLKQLPIAPAAKTGWPWTEESAPLPPTIPDGKPWPKISIVTPSFNQGQFIEETIRSVLLQNYPNLEYIIIDGGSTDNSVEIIKKYEPWLTYWVSEKDNGQPHAINKGLSHCSGEIFNWINSDDYLTSGALRIIAENFADCDLVAAAVMVFDGNSSTVIQPAGLSARNLIIGSKTVNFLQPGAWLRTDKLKQIGGLNETLQYCFDWLAFIRYLHEFQDVTYLPDKVANYRLHETSKTVSSSSKMRDDRIVMQALLLLDPTIADNYRYELLAYLKKQLRLHNINSINSGPHGNMRKVAKIISEIARDIISYPYRFALGAVRRLL